VFTCPAIWAVAVAKICGTFGYYLLSTKLPSYLEAVLSMPIQHNGYINALVYVAVSLTMCLAGPLSDWIRTKYQVRTNVLRKTNETIALFGEGICLALIPFAGCSELGVTGLLLLSMLLYGFTTGGDIPIVSELAPQYSGSIFGIVNSMSCTCGIFAPLIVGLVLGDEQDSLAAWSKVFYFAAFLSCLGNVVFLIWADATPAPWGVSAKRSAPKLSRAPPARLASVPEDIFCRSSCEEGQKNQGVFSQSVASSFNASPLSPSIGQSS